MAETTSTGVQTATDQLNWRSIFNRKESKDINPCMKPLSDETNHIINSIPNWIDKNGPDYDYFNKDNITLFFESLNIKDINDEKDKDLSVIIKTFNKFLKDNKYKFIFTENVLTNQNDDVSNNSDKKNKKNKKSDTKPLNSKEKALLAIKEKKTLESMKTFVESLVINNHMPIKSSKGIESFFTIVFWAIYLDNSQRIKIDSSIYLDCAKSLFNAIKDYTIFLPEIIILESEQLLRSIQSIIINREDKSHNNYFSFLKKNAQNDDCFWNQIKLKPYTLTFEQKQVIYHTYFNTIAKKKGLYQNLNTNRLGFLKLPPATGKTMLSILLAKFTENRPVLYICNTITTRNEVARDCINNDVTFYLATNRMDNQELVRRTFLDPFMNCYLGSWRQQHLRTKEQEKLHNANKHKKYSSDIGEQLEFCLNVTKRISEQYKGKIDPYTATNLPKKIICDLESAYPLLERYPGLFLVTNFDEISAAAEFEITSKILSVCGNTLLLSATCSTPDEIPGIVNHFVTRNHDENNDYQNVNRVYLIESNQQRTSCTFVDEEGYIFAPHDNVNNSEELADFVKSLDHPLIRRGYSPEVVFNFLGSIHNYLSEELQINNRFEFFGQITHESIRNYGSDIIKFIHETNNHELFQILKNIKVKKIKDMNVNTIFTTSAINYQSGKTLHVASEINFNLHVEDIAASFLEGSPKVSDIVSNYDKHLQLINDNIQSLEKNYTESSQYEKQELMKEKNNLKIMWPKEFVMNSSAHASKFNNYSFLTIPNNFNLLKREDIGLFEELREKLLFSNIGIYQPEEFNERELEYFLQNKNKYNFILSTPAIIYGTNIELSIVDIDESFLKDCTKNLIYQLAGRAGRWGKADSQEAIIIFRHKNFRIIFNHTKVNIESIQLETNFKKYIESIQLKA